MSDEPNVGGAAPGEGNATPAPAPEPAAPAGSLSGLLNGDAGSEDTGHPPEADSGPSWREDWRERLAGGDEKELARLKRFASIENVYKSFRQVEKKLSERPTAPTLPENATPEQIAEHRKALGVPDTPDGYGIEFSKDLPVDDSVKGALKSYAEFLHQHNVPAQYAKLSTQFYEQWAVQTVQQQVAEQQRAEARVYQELEKEHGPDFKRDMGILKEFGKDRPGIYPVLLANVSNKAFVQDMIQLALDLAPEEAFLGGEGGAGGKTADERLNELSEKSVRKTITAAERREYEGIIARQLKSQGRAA